MCQAAGGVKSPHTLAAISWYFNYSRRSEWRKSGRQAKEWWKNNDENAAGYFCQWIAICFVRYGDCVKRWQVPIYRYSCYTNVLFMFRFQFEMKCKPTQTTQPNTLQSRTEHDKRKETELYRATAKAWYISYYGIVYSTKWTNKLIPNSEKNYFSVLFSLSLSHRSLEWQAVALKWHWNSIKWNSIQFSASIPSFSARVFHLMIFFHIVPFSHLCAMPEQSHV